MTISGVPVSMNNHHFSSNRRNDERERCAFTAVVWPAIDASTQTGQVYTSSFKVGIIGNLSMSGLSFQSPVAYPIDTALWIRVRMGANTCQFKGVVRRTSTMSASGRRSYRCGVEFVRSQQTAHAQAIVAGYFHSICRRTHQHTGG